ncbi:MAG: TonB-dependent receptor [Bacteroidetes bacterium]|nr:MAG: TonB-dependent receptor [Bacteroidota bacterium]
MNRFLFLFVLLFISISFNVSAGYSSSTYTIRGFVFDNTTSEPLTGATVIIPNTNYYAISGLDGSFIIRNIPEGNYQLRVSFISFETFYKDIKLTQDENLSISLENVSVTLGTVEVVTTRLANTEASARATERNAMNVMNVISAREIEFSPDVTVANVVQRVSGVSLERSSSGDGQHAIVRGMDKRYNYTLVNGIKIPSPDPKNRYVPLDIFPSELLDRLEVTKALTPNMEGDAIGGVMDMKMKDAPDRFMLSFNAGTGYSQLFLDQDFQRFDRNLTAKKSPRRELGNEYRATIDDFSVDNLDFEDVRAPLNQTYGLAIGDRFWNGRMGAILAASYHNTYRGANSLFFETDVDRNTNNPFYDEVQVRRISTQQQRAGIHSKIDYRINSRNKIDLYNALITLTDIQARHRIDTNLRIGRGQGPGTGRIAERDRARMRTQQIFNTTLQGNHEVIDPLLIDWSAVYSRATNEEPDLAEVIRRSGTSRNSAGEIVKEIDLLDRDLNRRWVNNSDQDLAGYLNLTYFHEFSLIKAEYSVGGMYRHKERTNFYDNYLFRASPIYQEWVGSIFDHSWNLFNTQGTPTDPLNYESYENVMAWYAMVKADISQFQILGGVRVESTDFGWESNAPAQTPGRTGSISYQDILPSIHIKYSPWRNTNVRSSYFRSLSRPNFYEVIPYEINEGDYRERGNPFLQRTTADNFDLRFEYFPSQLDQILVGAFYKIIDDPIESALQISGQAIFLQPNNFGTANNMGVEVDITRYFRNFGIRAFYNFTDSRITTTKIFRFRDDNGQLTSREELQTRPLQGQSRHISNVSLLYKDQRNKLDVQLAMVYTGRRIISVSPYLDNDIWQRGFTQLDLSVEKGFGNHFKVFVKVNNLLNTPMRADILLPNTFNPEQVPYVDLQDDLLVREDFYKINGSIGLKYNL